MPQVIEPPTHTLSSVAVPRLKCDAKHYESLLSMELLPEKGYELIEGDIVEKMPVKDAHALVLVLVVGLFVRVCGMRLLRSPFTLAIDDHNLPEPDFAVLTTPNPTLSERGYIQPGDVRLVVEVSDATLPRDLTSKARLYANANIPEYWVIDIAGRRLLIHQTPGANGYSLVTQYEETETAWPAFAPTATFTVSDILP